MEIEGRKILVLGAGRSGTSSARFVAERGGTVALHDRKPIEEWSGEARSLKTTHNVGLLSGQIPSWLLDQIDLVVISPGISVNSVPQDMLTVRTARLSARSNWLTDFSRPCNRHNRFQWEDDNDDPRRRDPERRRNGRSVGVILERLFLIL